MSRKKWEPQTAITPALLKTREKRKWQIALRRYVLERNVCVDYAPYFGLDIERMRHWFECQFPPGIGWTSLVNNGSLSMYCRLPALIFQRRMS